MTIKRFLPDFFAGGKLGETENGQGSECEFLLSFFLSFIHYLKSPSQTHVFGGSLNIGNVKRICMGKGCWIASLAIQQLFPIQILLVFLRFKLLQTSNLAVLPIFSCSFHFWYSQRY